LNSGCRTLAIVQKWGKKIIKLEGKKKRKRATEASDSMNM